MHGASLTRAVPGLFPGANWGVIVWCLRPPSPSSDSPLFDTGSSWPEKSVVMLRDLPTDS